MKYKFKMTEPQYEKFKKDFRDIDIWPRAISTTVEIWYKYGIRDGSANSEGLDVIRLTNDYSVFNDSLLPEISFDEVFT